MVEKEDRLGIFGIMHHRESAGTGPRRPEAVAMAATAALVSTMGGLVPAH
jgi:hypothetical protein